MYPLRMTAPAAAAVSPSDANRMISDSESTSRSLNIMFQLFETGEVLLRQIERRRQSNADMRSAMRAEMEQTAVLTAQHSVLMDQNVFFRNSAGLIRQSIPGLEEIQQKVQEMEQEMQKLSHDSELEQQTFDEEKMRLMGEATLLHQNRNQTISDAVKQVAIEFAGHLKLLDQQIAELNEKSDAIATEIDQMRHLNHVKMAQMTANYEKELTIRRAEAAKKAVKIETEMERNEMQFMGDKSALKLAMDKEKERLRLQLRELREQRSRLSKAADLLPPGELSKRAAVHNKRMPPDSLAGQRHRSPVGVNKRPAHRTTDPLKCKSSNYFNFYQSSGRRH